MIRKLMMCAALLAGSAAANADVILDEGFNDVSTLAGSGWLTVDQSSAGGTQAPWFQGNDGIFAAGAGAANSYVAANFLATGPGGSIDAWLISPLLNVFGTTTVSFQTRSSGTPGFDDTLNVYASLGGSALTDFVLLGSISGANYPSDVWGTYGASGVFGTGSTIRLAFQYAIANTDSAGDYIGIDSVKVTSVPEPGTLALFAVALLLLPLAIRRRARQG